MQRKEEQECEETRKRKKRRIDRSIDRTNEWLLISTNLMMVAEAAANVYSKKKYARRPPSVSDKKNWR